MTTYLAIKDFAKHQHYKDRSPTWIKLYNSLLDDYGFLALPEVLQRHLMLLWLVASRTNNRLPDDGKLLAQAIKARGKVDIKALLASGFVVRVDASNPLAEPEHDASEMLDEPEQNASPHARGRAVARDRDREETETHTLPADAGATSSHVPLSLAQDLLALVPAPEEQIAISAFLAHTPPAKHAAWVARFTAWLTGHDFPSTTKCTADLLGTALREYVDEPGDYSPAHVKSFVIRTARQHTTLPPRSTPGVVSASPAARQEAEKLWAICKRSGIHHATKDTIDAELAKLVAAGEIDDADEFRATLRKLPIAFLRAAQSDHAAVNSILEKLAA